MLEEMRHPGMAARLVGSANAVIELMRHNRRAPIGDDDDLQPIRKRERLGPREGARVASAGEETKRGARGENAGGATHNALQGSGARQLEAAAVALDDHLAATGGAADRVLLRETALLGLRIERS